jgi:hypothetical protein
MRSNIEIFENNDNDKNCLYYIDYPLLDNSRNYSNISNINNLNSFIIIVDFPRLGGGTTNFLNTIILKYKYHQTFLILRNIDNLIHIVINEEYILEKKYSMDECIHFLNNNINKIEKIFVNHVMWHNDDFISKILDIPKEKTYITHDYFLIFNNPQPFYEDILNKKNMKNNIYINKFDKIITQNIENIKLLDPFIENNKNIVVTELPDYKKSHDLIHTNNNTIIIGLIGSISGIKGEKIVYDLNNYIIQNNLNMKIIVFGIIYIENIEYYEYKNIGELNNLLIQYKPNVLLESSIWPETYSYTLTLTMLTQLPIISLNKHFDSVIHNRLQKYDKKYFFSNVEDCAEIISIVCQDYFYTIDPNIFYNNFWDSYFITKKNKEFCLSNKFKYGIKPYLIYFPQFHNIEENNKRFYDGFTDITNLKHLIHDKKYTNLETPLFQDLGIESFQDYDFLTNNHIIKKQINIANDYKISGFAIYYYWFSKNEITNKNMIMENVINKFFDNQNNLQNLKVFFIWANENWSKNAAFGESELLIENMYTIENIKKNINNLINYFKHKNYLKIDNKPVFFIYHPVYMTNEEIDLFYELLNNECILNYFSGVHLVLNSIFNDYPNYSNFYINFNYKDTPLKYYDYNHNRYVIDYKKYSEDVNNSKKNKIQTIVYDFNNEARLSIPNKVHLSTICINNTEINKSLYTDKIIETYNNNSKKEIDKILLINAFNEWGEKMSFEPSNENGYYNLNLLKSKLTGNNNSKKNIVLITSKIYVSEYPFSYSNIRSSYTSEERFQQTIETIESIKKHIPNYFIVLFDNSKFSKYEIDTLKKMVDEFINITNDELLNYYTDIHETKAFADISQQIAFYDVFLKNIHINDIQNLFKISGRYLINENFNYSHYDNNNNIMKQNEKITNRPYFFTCFYKLDKSILVSYFNQLKIIRENKESYYNVDCQTIIPSIINNLTTLDNLGITQRIAIKHPYIDEHNDTII